MFEAQRDFVASAQHQLGVINAPSDNIAWQIIQGACDIIEHKAAGVRARGVALAARQCAAAASREDEILSGQMLGAMTRLIEQYAAGLAEVDTVEAIAIYEGIAPARSDAPMPDASSAADLAAKQDMARETLASVISLAKSSEQTALAKLISMSRAANDQSPEARSQMVAFETLMLPLTNSALSHAHHHNLRISLSYDGPETELSHMLAPTFKAALCALAQYRIETALLARPGALHHLALTAQQSPSGLTVRYEDGGAPEISARLGELPAIITLTNSGGWMANDGDAIILHCPLTAAQEMAMEHDPGLANNLMEALA